MCELLMKTQPGQLSPRKILYDSFTFIRFMYRCEKLLQENTFLRQNDLGWQNIEYLLCFKYQTCLDLISVHKGIQWTKRDYL